MKTFTTCTFSSFFLLTSQQLIFSPSLSFPYPLTAFVAEIQMHARRVCILFLLQRVVHIGYADAISFLLFPTSLRLHDCRPMVIARDVHITSDGFRVHLMEGARFFPRLPHRGIGIRER